MAELAENQTQQQSEIIRLDETMVNQIAAGEVIERPASVIKELVENAIDARANRIEVTTASGGKTLMRVTDNGIGMGHDALAMAVERHCTSKLSGDLMNITSLGFRGEALPSVGSVSRMTIRSRAQSAATADETAWQIMVTGGTVTGPEPAALSTGTVVEVTDLFYATPARLKFLKSDQAETNAITDVFKRIALAFPGIRFSLSGPDRSTLDYPAAKPVDRLEQVLGKEFRADAIEMDAEREGVTLSGLASVPTYHRDNALAQYFFVNGRPVKDKALLGAVRGAYSDFLPKGRYPVVALFIDIDPHLVDVNVHPAKADVRFRDPGLIRGLVVGSLKQALSGGGPLSSRGGAEAMMGAFKPQTHPAKPSDYYTQDQKGFSDWASPLNKEHKAGFGYSGMREEPSEYTNAIPPSGQVSDVGIDDPAVALYPLGSARAQLHENYIVAQTDKGLVIVDQHAAHERIVYEKLKDGLGVGMASQLLLVPEVVDLPEEDVSRLAAHAEGFTKLGLELEAFGPGAIAVRGTPALLGETDSKRLVQDLADEVAEWGSADGLLERLEAVAAT
ncbi:MAG: DNA mismatch repair endonuclease MutL, partial [Pseudomonadota bacterium]